MIGAIAVCHSFYSFYLNNHHQISPNKDQKGGKGRIELSRMDEKANQVQTVGSVVHPVRGGNSINPFDAQKRKAVLRGIIQKKTDSKQQCIASKDRIPNE